MSGEINDFENKVLVSQEENLGDNSKTESLNTGDVSSSAVLPPKVPVWKEDHLSPQPPDLFQMASSSFETDPKSESAQQTFAFHEEGGQTSDVGMSSSWSTENVDDNELSGTNKNDTPTSFPSFLQRSDEDTQFIGSEVFAKADQEEALDRGWGTQEIDGEKPTSFPSFLRDGIVDSIENKENNQANLSVTDDVVESTEVVSEGVSDEEESSVVSEPLSSVTPPVVPPIETNAVTDVKVFEESQAEEDNIIQSEESETEVPSAPTLSMQAPVVPPFVSSQTEDVSSIENQDTEFDKGESSINNEEEEPRDLSVTDDVVESTEVVSEGVSDEEESSVVSEPLSSVTPPVIPPIETEAVTDVKVFEESQAEEDNFIQSEESETEEPSAPTLSMQAPIVPPFVQEEKSDSVSDMSVSSLLAGIPNTGDISSSFSISAKPGPGYQTDNMAKPPIAKDIETLKLETVAEEDEVTEEKEAALSSESTEENDAEQENKEPANYKSANFLTELFANGNECITAADGSFPVQEGVRQLLALFSNGRFFVAESAKFDGRVLGLEYKARKRRLQVGKPEYVPTIVLNDIYEYVSRSRSVEPVVDTDNQEQARMQRDFVTIISRAAMERVSDIHIVVADHTTVMFRINGLMQTEMEYNKEWGESFVRAAFASSDISDSNYAQNEYQAAQKLGRTPLRGSNGRLVLPRNVLGIRLQFNPIAFGTRYVVMRLLYAEESADSVTDLEVLGFTKRESDLFYQLRSVPTGIVIISGPTGSGKSTTLQRNMISMLRERNYEINLITVEDPPEYPIPGARQMPVTNASIEEAKDREFTRALSAALRSDPDSLMIGEIRTLSAADLAFRGALSGHNVWTTLHANSAPAVLMRLKDMGVEDFKLQDPDIMKGMLAQRLFRKVCPYCRVSAATRLDHPAVQRLRRAFGDIGLSHAFLRGAGCKECDFRGVRGRTVVSEFILPDATFLDLMIRGDSKKAINYWINDLDGQTLRDGALARMLEGIIDIEEVERWTGFLDQQMIS